LFCPHCDFFFFRGITLKANPSEPVFLAGLSPLPRARNAFSPHQYFFSPKGGHARFICFFDWSPHCAPALIPVFLFRKKYRGFFPVDPTKKKMTTPTRGSVPGNFPLSRSESDFLKILLLFLPRWTLSLVAQLRLPVFFTPPHGCLCGSFASDCMLPFFHVPRGGVSSSLFEIFSPLTPRPAPSARRFFQQWESCIPIFPGELSCRPGLCSPPPHSFKNRMPLMQAFFKPTLRASTPAGPFCPP